ncbi:MAG TPA: hypothetical protein P5121_19460 [Caldilineaceae bacterium]|nr:hypothetical protein [Caldilineaceae bacterium]
MPNRYQLRVAEALDPAWATWLGIHTMTHNAEGTTTITAHFANQEGLFQLLHKMGELGMTLLAVEVRQEDEDFPSIISERE